MSHTIHGEITTFKAPKRQPAAVEQQVTGHQVLHVSAQNVCGDFHQPLVLKEKLQCRQW